MLPIITYIVPVILLAGRRMLPIMTNIVPLILLAPDARFVLLLCMDPSRLGRTSYTRLSYHSIVWYSIVYYGIVRWEELRIPGLVTIL